VSQPPPEYTRHTDAEYEALAADRERRIKDAVEKSYRNAQRESAKRRTQARRFARRQKRDERGA
jgi:hypothetical protein